jgi:quercetin dioxygenase-like cupin family protein
VRVELDVPQDVLLAVDDGEAVSDGAERTVRIVFEHELIDVTWSRYEHGENGPDPHVHHEHTDSFYVVEGELEFGVGPDVEKVRAPAGTFVLVPPNVVHTFRNVSGATAKYLNFHAPSTGFAAYLRGEDSAFDNSDPPADGGRPAADAIVTLPGGGERFERHNRVVTLLGDHVQLSANVIEFEPSFQVPLHTHDDQVDSFFVLEGELEFVGNDNSATAGLGMWFSAPPHVVHGFRSSVGARFLNVHAPDAGFAASVRNQ